MIGERTTGPVRWRPLARHGELMRAETREWHDGLMFIIEGVPGRWTLYAKSPRKTTQVCVCKNDQHAKGIVGAWAIVARALNAGRLPK